VIFIVVLVLVVALVGGVVYGVAKDPGPTPIEIALGYEHAWDEHDFDVIYRLSGYELHDGMTKADWIAAQREAHPRGSALGHAVESVVAEDETREGDAAAVVTCRTLRDGTIAHNQVQLLRRSRAWEVVGYELRPAPAS
jgi:hypothetical protein